MNNKNVIVSVGLIGLAIFIFMKNKKAQTHSNFSNSCGACNH